MNAQRIKVRTNSKRLITLLTSGLQKLEDQDWLGVGPKNELRILLAKIRQKKVFLSFQPFEPTNSGVGPNSAKTLARTALGMVSDRSDTPIVYPRNAHTVQGGRLSRMTQSTMYKAIVSIKKVKPRRSTTINLDITRHGIKSVNGDLPDDEVIWQSLKNKVFPQRIRAFMWRAMHDAYKCGKWWEAIEGYEHRGRCHVCDTEESLDHVLTECKASGQDTIWKLAEELWDIRALPWVKPSLGILLGSGLIKIKGTDGMNLPGASRLYTIIVSESMYMIWQVRCKWRIRQEADPQKISTGDQLRRTWVKMINRRLQLEMLMTNVSRFGSKALDSRVVERTWWAILQDRDQLQGNWTRNTGVLVGIGARPPGRNR